MSVSAPQRIARVPGGELIAALSAILLVALMFLVQWYGIAGVSGAFASRSGSSSAENAWHGLTTLRWLMLATVLAAIVSLVVRVTQRFHRTQANLGVIVMALGSVTSLLLVYRVLLDLPAPGRVIDQKIGAFLGLLSAIGIAFGGYESHRETRRFGRDVVQRRRS
jgi:hypothetical protein